jgi:DNA-binding response OmpR family regulator
MTAKPKLLLVDDDPDIHLSIGMMLRAEGYEVTSARDGVEAMKSIYKSRPDLVILDLLMPRKDGFAVVREIRDDPEYADLPILILTAVAEDASRRRYELETGSDMAVQDYVEKRIRPAELLRRLRRLLPEGDQPELSSQEAEPAQLKATVLLIDDDPDFVDGTRMTLEANGFRTLTALNGADGLALAHSERPDLILLDIIMPNQDGFVVCETLKSDPVLADIPVIMLTSYSDRLRRSSYAAVQGLMMEADDYLDKPVRPAELVRRVEATLRVKQR